jgi:hypothetical protein
MSVSVLPERFDLLPLIVFVLERCCCLLDSPHRHFGCRRRFWLAADYARDNPVYRARP